MDRNIVDVFVRLFRSYCHQQGNDNQDQHEQEGVYKVKLQGSLEFTVHQRFYVISDADDFIRRTDAVPVGKAVIKCR